ncbi:LysR family transcriptional regulator [Fodinicurvata sediminis]|uniref:LysR family transcriptional regulator n=1 Tax=Fodinicurvata sediminis TaxID=1121832 RepID=UPI0003B3C4BD|nr:LysR family transcriptional regulator [Fodinicurvata sediminis]
MATSKNINWNLLYTFVVVAEAQSISRAAHILGRGQPAVSAALKSLEEQVGLQLIERGPRLFKLTEAGRLLHREASEICGAVDRILVLLKDSDSILTGSVRLTIASHMTSPVLNRALQAFHTRHQRAAISCTVMNTPEMLEALSNRLIHFGIGPIFRKQPEFSYFHLFKEHCGFYCGPSHELFGRRDLQLSDLKGYNEITYQSAILSDALNSISEMQSKIGFREPPTGVANNLEEVRRMILSGLGIGAIPVQIAARDVRDGLLWRLPPYDQVMPIDVYLIMNEKVRPSQTEQAFLDILKEVVESTPVEERVYASDTYTELLQ